MSDEVKAGGPHRELVIYTIACAVEDYLCRYGLHAQMPDWVKETKPRSGMTNICEPVADAIIALFAANTPRGDEEPELEMKANLEPVGKASRMEPEVPADRSEERCVKCGLPHRVFVHDDPTDNGHDFVPPSAPAPEPRVTLAELRRMNPSAPVCVGTLLDILEELLS